MAKIMKRSTALVLALILVLGQIAMPAFANTTETVKVDGVVVPDQTHIPADTTSYTAEIKTETSYGPNPGHQVPALDANGNQVGTYDTTVSGGTESTTNITNTHGTDQTVDPDLDALAPDIGEFQDKGNIVSGPNSDPAEGWNEEQGEWQKQEGYDSLENSTSEGLTFSDVGDPVPVNGGQSMTGTVTDPDKIDVGVLPEVTENGTPVSENGELDFQPTVELVPIGIAVESTLVLDDANKGTLNENDDSQTQLKNKQNESGYQNKELPFNKKDIKVVIDGKWYPFEQNGGGDWVIKGLIEQGLANVDSKDIIIVWVGDDGKTYQCEASMNNHADQNGNNGNNKEGTDNYDIGGIETQYGKKANGDTDSYETEITMQNVVPKEYWNIAKPITDAGNNVIGWEVELKPNSNEYTYSQETGSMSYYYNTESVTDNTLETLLDGEAKKQIPSEDGTSMTTYEKTVTQEPKKIQTGLNADGIPIYKIATDENGVELYNEDGTPVYEIAKDADGNELKSDVITYTETQSTSEIIRDDGVEVTLTEKEKLDQLALMNIKPDATEETFEILTAPDTTALPQTDGGNTLVYDVVPTYTTDENGNQVLTSYTLKTTAYDANGMLAYTHEETVNRAKTTTEHYLIVDEITGLQVTFKKKTTEVAKTSQFDKLIVEATKTFEREKTTTTTEKIVHRYMAEGTDETIDNGKQMFEFNGQMFPVNALGENVALDSVEESGITLLNKVTTTDGEGNTVNKTVNVGGVQQQVYNANVTVEIKNTFFGLGKNKVAILRDGNKEIGRFELVAPKNTSEGDSTLYTLNAELTNGVQFTVNIVDPEIGEYSLLDKEVSGAVNVAAISGADLAFDLSFTASAPDYVHTTTTTTTAATQKQQAEKSLSMERRDSRTRTVTTVYETEGKPVITIQGKYAVGTKTTTTQDTAWEHVDYEFTPAGGGTPRDGGGGGGIVPPPGGGVPMVMALDIEDEPVPLVHAPEEVILDEEVPLADAPSTGDASIVWAAMSMMSMGGYVFLGKKEKKSTKGGKYLKK